MDSFADIRDRMNAPKGEKKKAIKMKDVFSNSKTPNKVISYSKERA
jgi:hypothetical protein